MNIIGIGTQIPTATAHTIQTAGITNAVEAHRLTTKWAKATAKSLANTKAWADQLAGDLMENPDTEDLDSLTQWLAARTN